MTGEGRRQQAAELEAYLDLGARLGLRQGLPYMRHWSAGADFLSLLVDHVLAHRPSAIVECGSGLSTLMLARCCALNGDGRVWSLENDPDCAAHTRDALARYGLEQVVRVVDAPLRRYSLNTQEFDWYDLGGLPTRAIELLIVDGPPGRLGPLARYPALPLLRERLAPRCTIFLDDAARPDEQAIVARWCAEHPDLALDRPATERGCAVLRRRSQASSEAL